MTSVVPLLEDKRIVICAGSGGVGKTTTSAALAMGMAAQGLRVAVVTIDPAKRLANALGLEQLGNEPQRDRQFVQLVMRPHKGHGAVGPRLTGHVHNLDARFP